MLMKRLRPLEFTIAALLLSAAHLAACIPVFSFSVYNDASITDDESTIYGYTTTEDTSTLCSCVHSDYTAAAAVYDPNGTLLGDSVVSGFSSSVSAPMDGVSGDYQSSGAGVAYCSCLQGYFGGGGTIYYVAASCPTTVTVSSTPSISLAAGYQNNFPNYKTRFGIMATIQVGPGNMNGAAVTESVSNGATNRCPTGVAAACSGNSTFTVGPTSGGTYYGNSIPGAGSNQFQDEHIVRNTGDVLAGYSANYSCTQTCSQIYSACSQPVGSFTITRTYTHSSISGTPVTQITVTTTSTQ